MATRRPQLYDIADPEAGLPRALEAEWSPAGAPLPPAPRVRPLPSPSPHRIIVKAVNWLGDLVMSGPALHAIHDTFPDAHVAVLVRRELASFYDGATWVDEVIPYRLRRGLAGTLDQLSIVRRIRAGHFDLGVVFPNSFRSAMWMALGGVQRRAGYDTDRRGFLLSHKAAPRADVAAAHQVYHWLTMVAETVGARGSAAACHLDVNPQSRDRMRAWLANRRRYPERPLIALAPVAAYGPAKEWPAERYAELADLLAVRHGAECVLVGGIDDRPQCERIAVECGRGAIVAAAETTVGELIALLAQCHGFVGNDSGCMHLAGALGVPTVAIFGSTNPLRTGPMGPHCTVIYRGIECSPCLERTCRFGHYNCLRQITAEEAADALAASGIFA
ncbi:MAG TPA: lipopolysaccharide heptosyltransferase II [Candidatus Binataceae bacterium]|nr:lipopolysaccharide heptosyltransferase II [Candidatus Binataceae bacterium]